MRTLLPVLLLLAGCGTPTMLTTPVQPPTPAAACQVVDGKADRRCTPGKTNPQVTQANLATTVCRRGWTDTIRPPTSYTNRLKSQQLAAYGLPGPPTLYEEDHLIPLALGGDPRDPANLYPAPWDGPTGAHAKDGRERALQRAVCNGRVRLVDAQHQIVAEWTH